MPSVAHILQNQNNYRSITVSVATMIYVTCTNVITLEADIISGTKSGHTFQWVQTGGTTVTFLTTQYDLITSFQQTQVADDKSFDFIIDLGTINEQRFHVKVVATPTDFVNFSKVNKYTNGFQNYGSAQLPTNVVLTPDYGVSGVANTYSLTQLQWQMNTSYNPYGFNIYKGSTFVATDLSNMYGLYTQTVPNDSTVASIVTLSRLPGMANWRPLPAINATHAPTDNQVSVGARENIVIPNLKSGNVLSTNTLFLTKFEQWVTDYVTIPKFNSNNVLTTSNLFLTLEVFNATDEYITIPSMKSKSYYLKTSVNSVGMSSIGG